MDNFRDAFNFASDPNREARDSANKSTLAQLQMVQGVEGLAAKAEALRRERAARAAIDALGPSPTDEQVMGAIRPHVGIDKLAQLTEHAQTSRLTRENTKAIQMARIDQNQGKIDDSYDLALQKLESEKDPNSRKSQEFALKSWKAKADVALAQERAAQGGDRQYYETGIRRPPINLGAALQPPDIAQPAGPPMSPSPPQTPQGVPRAYVSPANFPRESPEQRAAAGGRQVAILQAELDANTAAGKPADPQLAAELEKAKIGATGQYPRTNPVMSGASALAAPDAANLDANDMRARAKAAFDASRQAPAAAAPGISTEPVAPVSAAPITPQMPKFSGPPKEVAHQENMWKQAQSKSVGAAALGPDSIKIAGWEKLMFGTDPKGMGTASAQQRAQVADERARIGKSLGLSEQEMAMMPYDANTKKKAIGNMINWGAGIGKSQEQLDQSIDLAMGYVDKIGPGRLKALNLAIIGGEKQFNDPDANAYALAVNTVRTEYARLMTGPTSNAMLPVEAIKKGDDLISNGFDKKSWQEIKTFIGKEAKITRSSVDNQVSQLRNSLLPKGAAPDAGGPAERRAEPRATEKRTVVNF